MTPGFGTRMGTGRRVEMRENVGNSQCLVTLQLRVSHPLLSPLFSLGSFCPLQAMTENILLGSVSCFSLPLAWPPVSDSLYLQSVSRDPSTCGSKNVHCIVLKTYRICFPVVFLWKCKPCLGFYVETMRYFSGRTQFRSGSIHILCTALYTISWG